VPGTANWSTQSEAANFVVKSYETANWLIQSTLQDSLQTPILMGSRGSMVTRWLGEHGTTVWRSVKAGGYLETKEMCSKDTSLCKIRC
jgi:hypothetical protein